MLKKLFSRFQPKPIQPPKPNGSARISDPMDPMSRIGIGSGWDDDGTKKPMELTLRTHNDFPLHELSEGDTGKTMGGKTIAMDGAAVSSRAYDSRVSTNMCEGPGGSHIQGSPIYGVPESLASWFMTQTFIGYQACAIIAQHWLVDKACSQAGEDAVRNGWTVKAKGEDELSDEEHARIVEFDETFSLKNQLQQLNRFKNIFGIRVALFEVKSDDPDYYEKPFNIDGVREGSYTGISQIDPYWMTPMLTAASTSNPAGKHFYDPDFWIISGRKYHRSHLIIARAPEPADILKPTYMFGGIPLTQRIYERVYAAERTANEAPLLALNKRTTAIHVDMEKAVLNEKKFLDKLNFWVKYRDNHAVKVLGKEETIDQFDTSLTDFDSVIMNQYQLVAAIARTPSTKLLGTSPKGFNATGEFETVSYHEELESIQEHTMGPMLERHYLLTAKSLGLSVALQYNFEPVDSVTAEKQATINKTKAETGQVLINSGALSPEEERNRIRDENNSGYNRLTDDEASEVPGESPENLAAFEKAGADKEKASAAVVAGSARAAAAGVEPNPTAGENEPSAAAQEQALPGAPQPLAPAVAPTTAKGKAAKVIAQLIELLGQVDDTLIPDGIDSLTGSSEVPGRARSTLPGTKPSVLPTVAGAGYVAPPTEGFKLPKLKVHGMIAEIENPRGTIRKGGTLSGKSWAIKMAHHYGYLKGVMGFDGDELDCLVGPNMNAANVFVVHQMDREGAFDEHKCMMGFDTVEDAQAAYMGMYSKGWDGMGKVVPMPVASFKSWCASGAPARGE